MLDNPRNFDVTDPFGRKWSVTFRWHQNAISIRHADAIDVKWEMLADDGTKMDKVIALSHPVILAASQKAGRELTDAWCIRLAALHLRSIIETWDDSDKVIVTPTAEQIEELAQKLEQAITASR